MVPPLRWAAAVSCALAVHAQMFNSQVDTYPLGTGVHTDVAYSHDGKWCVIPGKPAGGSVKENVVVYDTKGMLGGMLNVFLEQTRIVDSTQKGGPVAFNVDSSRLARGLENGDTLIYETVGWSSVLTLSGHTSDVNELEYSRDGSMFVTGGNDGVNEGTTAGAADEDEVYEFDILYKVALATAVASAPTGYAMPSALRFVIASRSCESQQPGMNYSRVLHPTQLTLSGSNELGMVAGNAALLLVVTLLCALLLWLLQTAGPKCLPEWLADEDMQGYLRLPSGPLTALQFLYQGLILGSAKLVLQGPASYIAYGAAGVGFCVLAPVMVVRKVPGSASSPRDKCRYFLDATMPPAPGRFTKAWAYLCICGPGDYVNTHRSVAWVSRYNVAIRQFTPGCLYWMAVDFTYTLFIAALHGPGIYGHHLVQCAYQKLFTGLASLLMFAVYVRQRPFNKTRDLYAEGGASLLQGVAYLCMATGYFLGDVRHVSFSIAAWLLVSALGLIVAKAACDVIWAALSFSRVARLQEAYDAAAKDRLRVEDMVAIDTSSPTLTRSQGGGVSAKSVTSASCRIPSDTNTMMSKTMPSLSDADAIPTTPMLGRGSRATFKAGSPRRLPLGVSGLKPYDCDGSPFITPKSPASPVSRLVPQQMI